MKIEFDGYNNVYINDVFFRITFLRDIHEGNIRTIKEAEKRIKKIAENFFKKYPEYLV